MLKLFFSDKYVGSGVLDDSLNKENICFFTYPEMIVSMVFMEILADHESIVIANCLRFNNHRIVDGQILYSKRDEFLERKDRLSKK